jgi:hypothetical protein
MTAMTATYPVSPSVIFPSQTTSSRLGCGCVLTRRTPCDKTWPGAGHLECSRRFGTAVGADSFSCETSVALPILEAHPQGERYLGSCRRYGGESEPHREMPTRWQISELVSATWESHCGEMPPRSPLSLHIPRLLLGPFVCYFWGAACRVGCGRVGFV